MNTGRHLAHLFTLDLRVLLAFFLVTGTFYMAASPIFETPDEVDHFGVVEYIRLHGALPVQDPAQPDTHYRQEGSQPPLYYALVALLTRPISFDGLDDLRQFNPHARLGIPGDPDNRNMVLHAPSRPPLRDAALAVYAGRVFSLLLGAVTVTVVYHTATAVAPDSLRRVVPLLAAGLVAVNPQFLFIAGSVNNDNLVTALNSGVILLMVLMLRDGFDTRRSLLIAVLIALATLSKLSGLVLVPVVALAGLWVAYSRRDLRGLVILGTAMAGVWALLAGWWYLRNLMLYGELFGTGTMVEIFGARAEAFTAASLLAEFEGFRMSYWGLFGSVNIWIHPVYYRVMDLLTLLALTGFLAMLWRLWRARDRFRLAAVTLLSLALAIASASLISWTAQTYASQGRLLFPVTAASSTLFALGVGWWVEAAARRMRRITPRGVVAGGLALWAVVALVTPFAVIAPVYAIPQALHGLPPGVTGVYARYGDVVELIGYQVEDRRYAPGDRVPVTLYWRALAQTEVDYSLFVHAIPSGMEEAGGANADIGKIDSFPGAGLLRTSTWEPGALYADRYVVPLADDAVGMGPLRLQVGWWERESGVYLRASDGQQDGVTVLLDAGGFAGEATVPDADAFVQVEEATGFGGAIHLRGYRLEAAHAEDVMAVLSLLWEATAALDGAYTVFAQALATSNDGTVSVVAQGDAPPDLPTQYWRAGERFVTRHVLRAEAMQPGSYPLVVGWYDPAGFTRLLTPLQYDFYTVTELHVDG